VAGKKGGKRRFIGEKEGIRPKTERKEKGANLDWSDRSTVKRQRDLPNTALRKKGYIITTGMDSPQWGRQA